MGGEETGNRTWAHRWRLDLSRRPLTFFWFSCGECLRHKQHTPLADRPGFAHSAPSMDCVSYSLHWADWAASPASVHWLVPRCFAFWRHCAQLDDPALRPSAFPQFAASARLAPSPTRLCSIHRAGGLHTSTTRESCDTSYSPLFSFAVASWFPSQLAR